MEKASPLPLFHWNYRISSTVHYSHSVPICFSTVCHESPELNVIHSMSLDYQIQIPLEKNLSSVILRLHITHSNCHDFAIHGVVDMTCHGCPLFHSLNMVEHHPSALKITSCLHALHEVYTTTRANLGHFKDKDLILVGPLTWELTLLNKGPLTSTVQLRYAINDPKLPEMFK